MRQIKKNMEDAADGENEFEAVGQRLSESQKFSLYKTLRDTVVFETPCMSHQKNKDQNKLQKEKGLEELSQKHNYIHAYTLSHFIFEVFPCLCRAKGPKRERQALSSDRERVEQPPSLFTHD